MKSLSELCEISLMRNHLQLAEVKNIPYRLIRNILWKVKMPQLVKLESSNVLLTFEDGEMWLNFLKQDFPTCVHECFLSRKEDIKQYYLCFIKENDPQLLEQEAELVKSCLQSVISKDPCKNKYRMPYRMLYQKYQEDVKKKQEKCTERLRLQMRQLQQEREKNQTVVVDQSFYLKNQPRKTSKLPSKEHHSELFRKSVKDHSSRLRHFKSGGFDIAKRHSTRVAFGGAAGGAANDPPRLPPSAIQPNSPSACAQTSKSGVQPQPKRRLDPPSIFLQRKRPCLMRSSSMTDSPITNHTSNSGGDPTEEPTVRRTAAGHKKKSAIFSVSSRQLPPHLDRSPHREDRDTQMVYIFDKSRAQDR